MKTELLDFIRFVRDEAHRMAAELPPEERDEPSTYLLWNFKDNIAHLTDSVADMADRLEGKQVPVVDDFEAGNRSIYETSLDLPWQTVQARMDQAYDRVLAAVENLSEEELFDPGSNVLHAWQAGTPLWRRVAGSACLHPMTHLTLYLQQRDRHTEALELGERADNAALRLTDDPNWWAVNRYNRACLYALAGDGEHAAPLLAESFTARPDLRQLARQDTDLDKIRMHPSVLALLAG